MRSDADKGRKNGNNVTIVFTQSFWGTAGSTVFHVEPIRQAPW